MTDRIVSKNTLKEVREASDSQEARFLVISYDLPSERRSWHDLSDEEEEERQSKLKSNRQKILRKASLLGIQLAQSVYIVRADHIMQILNKVDELYEEEEVKDYVNVNIIGNSYKHVVKNLILDFLEEKTQEVGDELEILEQDIKYIEDAERSKYQFKRALWELSKDVKSMRKRVEDLEEIDSERANKYSDKVENLEEKRKALLDHSNLE